MLLLLLLPSVALASFCGQQAVPFTFQALKSGQPVLGCARPRCFSSGSINSTGEPAQFYRIHGKEDGYMRKAEGVRGGRNEMAACSMSFGSSSCGIGQWVGGIQPQADVRSRTQLRCCAYGPLLQSEDRGIATVRPGQLVVGGEVSVDGRVVAFDYVADLAKTVKEDGSIEYNVALRRMSCFDEPAGSAEVGAPSDISLQQISEQPKAAPQPYSPWANPPPSVPAAPRPVVPRQRRPQPTAAAAAPVETATEYPGQPIGLQPEPLEKSHGRTAPAAAAAAAPQMTYEQQQQAMMNQQTVALAYNNPQMNPMMAQIAAQQEQLAQQQKALLEAQQQLLAAQQAQLQQAQQMQQQQQQVRQPLAAPPGTAALPIAAPAAAVDQQIAAAVKNNPGLAALVAANPGLVQAARGMAALGQPPAPQPTGQMGMPRLPNLEELPKMNIPSIEQVENAIPPLEKAVLTTVARFFGVL